MCYRLWERGDVRPNVYTYTYMIGDVGIFFNFRVAYTYTCIHGRTRDMMNNESMSDCH